MRLVLAAGAASLLCAPLAAHAGGALDAVRAAGILHCGSNGAGEDYTRVDTHGDLTELAAEICKAVAVAVIGPDARTEVREWPDERHMLEAVRDGTTALAIGAAPSVGNATGFGVSFAPPVFYDGQGFLAETGIGATADLAGKQICFLGDAQLGETLRQAMRTRGIAYQPFPFEELGEMEAAAGTGHCPAITGNFSQLVNMQTGFPPIGRRFHLLPETLTKDPVSPAYRTDDPQWGVIVSAVVNALIQAEESGITAANAEQMKGSDDIVVQYLIGQHSIGHLMGLRGDWALLAIKAVGNYGEIYERTLGGESAFKLPRGPNHPWSRGGLMYAQPLR